MSSTDKKYDINKISFEWVQEATDRKEVKRAYEAIKHEGGYYDLEQALKKKLATLDPTFKRRIDEKPLTKEEKENIDTDLDKFLASANQDDESLQGKHSKNIFSNPKEEAAARIGKRKQAENERLKGNDLMKSKDYDMAIDCYNKAIALDPNEASTYSNRALAYINKKQYSKSIDDANIAIALDPEYIKAYYRRGKAYELCKKYELAIKDYEHILEKEPNNKRIKKELLTLRAEFKENSGAESSEKKFRKMKIEEADSSAKVEEIIETKQVSGVKSQPAENPVVEDEGKENIKPYGDVKPTVVSSNELNGHAETTLTPKEEPKKSEFVKLQIEETEESSEDEDDAKPQAQATQPTSTETPTTLAEEERITKFDKDLLKHEQVSNDFINSLAEEVEHPKPQTPTKTPAEVKEEPKQEELKVEQTPEEIEEEERLQQIESELANYKESAKAEHQKGMFEVAIEIYQEALLFIETKEHQFKYRLSDLIAKKCALWNNIAAWYKQYQNADKEIEYATLVINHADHLKSDPTILFKAYFRRGCAYEKIEKYSKAKDDLEYCRQKQPFNMDVTTHLNHVKDALSHEEKEKNTRSMMSSQKLLNTLEEHKIKGNEFFKENKLGKDFINSNQIYRPSNRILHKRNWHL